MNLQTKILVFFLFLGLSVQAQKKVYYTHVSDRKFTEPHELYGYTLIPNEWEDANGRRGKLAAGEVKFSIVRGYLRVVGGKAEGMYGINRIELEGRNVIRVSLLDAKDPANQGSLKVIIDDNQYIDAYIFRRSRNADEIIYYQKGLSARQKESNKEFFTDENELILAEDADLWGKTIRPFFVLTRSICHRLYPQDSVSFQFIEEIVVKEKPKKEEKPIAAKPAKKEKKKGAKKVEEEEDEFEDEFEDEQEEEDFGFFKVVDEEEAALEQAIEEETTEETEEAVEEETPVENKTEAKASKVAKEKAPKEKRSYKVIYKHNEWVGDSEDGYMDEKEDELVIKKWKRLTSRYDGDKNTRYVLEITTNKGEIFLYMNEKNAVSMLEFQGNRYLMRGY